MLKRVLLSSGLTCLACIAALAGGSGVSAGEARHVTLVVPPGSHPRVEYGVTRLREALEHAGYAVESIHRPPGSPDPHMIAVGTRADGPVFADALSGAPGGPEAYVLLCRPGERVVIAGDEAAGALYGCLELAERVESCSGKLPRTLDLHDAPAMRLRGPCIMLTRPEPTYDGAFYDHPYLPGDFPWFYDRARWLDFLDLLARYRFNSLYLWSGHPFTSILRLKQYPEAQELTDEQLEANISLFRWLCEEADRRNIWVVQNHYNIHMSHALARHHGLNAEANVKNQGLSPYSYRKPTPLLSDYMRYCYAEFFRNYPNVGLMLCLGESLDYDQGPAWMRDVVIPGVKAGLQPGQAEPPIIVRGHNTPIFDVLAACKPVYSNLYVEAKYSNEDLASDTIGGGTDPHVDRWYPWEQDGQAYVRLARETHLITNLHCLANLEPFRWGSPDFTRRAVTSALNIGAEGLHLFSLRYADWPLTADRAEPRLWQYERDWLWYAVWARYSWNPARDKTAENTFWAQEIGERFGSKRAGRLLLEAFEHGGEVLPWVSRAFAVDSSNWFPKTLGQTLPQCFVSRRWYNPKPGETILAYARHEADGKPHQGETPFDATAAMVRFGAAAVKAAEAAGAHVTSNPAEYERIANDMRATELVARFYAHKVDAAVAALVYQQTGAPDQLDRLVKSLRASVDVYRDLAALTDKTYMDCAGRHDPGRKYPYPAPEHLVWSDVLPRFEEEYDIVRHNVDYIRSHPDSVRAIAARAVYPAATIYGQGEGPYATTYPVAPDAKPWFDRPETFGPDLPKEFVGLKAIPFSDADARKGPLPIKFVTTEPMKAFVAFRAQPDPEWAQPTSEWTLYRKGCVIAGETCDIYWRDFPDWQCTLSLPKGTFVLLGLTPQYVHISTEPATVPLHILLNERLS